MILTIFLSACNKEKKEKIQEKFFGVENLQELVVQLPQQVICGQDGAWFITAIRNDFIYQLKFDAEVVRMEKLEYQPKKGDYSIISIAEYDGMLYAQLQNRENNKLEICKHHANGSWSSVMSIKPEGEENYAVVGNEFFVDGNENVYLVDKNIVARYGRDGKRSSVYELDGTICSFQENGEGHVECITVGTKGIIMYELTETGAEEKWIFQSTAEKVHFIQCSGEEMLCLATDMEILFLDRESGKAIAKTDFVKLGVPVPLTGYYDEGEEKLRLYSLAEAGKAGLCISLLNGKETFTEQRTELIYGVVSKVNSDASSSIRTAINTFNQKNKDYYVTVRDYNGNLELMQAELATGNGPDIIDMMDSDYYESYVKNGYLENLSNYFEQSEYKDDIIWNVLDTYKVEDGLYLFVPQFQLEGLLIHPKYVSLIEDWNMETFLELIEKNKWEKDIFGGTVGDPQLLLKCLLYGRQENFINWEQKTAAFETKAFTDMLELCKEYAQADWSAAKEWTSEEKEWNTLCLQVTYGGGFYSYLNYVDIYGREYPVYGFPMLTGQIYGISPGVDSCAIYSGSKQKEGAWEFIESLLEECNQKYSGMVNPGFPIRSSVLEEMVERDMEIGFGKQKLTVMESEISILEDIIYNGKLSNTLIEPNIWNVICEEAASYFAGDKEAEEVAHIIQSRVQIILAE